MSSSNESGLIQFMQDFRDYSHRHVFHLVGSTEQISDNLDELSAQERWERDEHVENDAAFVLQAEEQMAVMDLRSARNMFRLSRGIDQERHRVQVSDLIAQIRAIRFELAQLGGAQ